MAVDLQGENWATSQVCEEALEALLVLKVELVYHLLHGSLYYLDMKEK